MIVNRHKYFKWTPRTTWLTLTYVVFVPAAFGYMGYMTDVRELRCSIAIANTRAQGKWNFRAKLRGDTASEW